MPSARSTKKQKALVNSSPYEGIGKLQAANPAITTVVIF